MPNFVTIELLVQKITSKTRRCRKKEEYPNLQESHRFDELKKPTAFYYRPPPPPPPVNE